jgi:hypothetical protein
MHIDDETLIAYLDGQLPEADYAPVEQALAESETLRERLQALVDSGELARRSFDAVLLEPVPPSLIASIWRAPDPRVQRPPAGGAGRPGTPWLWRFFGMTTGRRTWTALASVLLLAVGGVLGWQMLQPAEEVRWSLREGQRVEDPSLALALEVSPSGRVLRTASGAVEVLASFERTGGGHCREFNRSTPRGTRDELGIACRTSGGDWQLEFLRSEEREADGGASTYQTASDRQHEAADAFLRERVNGPALEEGEEIALIARGWQP